MHACSVECLFPKKFVRETLKSSEVRFTKVIIIIASYIIICTYVAIQSVILIVLNVLYRVDGRILSRVHFADFLLTPPKMKRNCFRHYGQ